MKCKKTIKFIAIVLSAAMLSAAVFSAEAFAAKAEILTSKSKEYHVLLIGSSLNLNTSRYLSDAAASAGYKVTTGICYKGGSGILDHYEYCSGQEPNSMKYIERIKGKLVESSYPTFDQVIGKHAWDAIVILSGSKLSDATAENQDGESYVELLCKTIRNCYEKRNVTPPPIGINLTWSRKDNTVQDMVFVQNWNSSSLAMYKEFMTVWKNVLDINECTDFRVYSGTAIQNARTTYLAKYLECDDRHLNSGYGSFLASISLYAALGGPVGEVQTIKYSSKAGVTSGAHTTLLKKCAQYAQMAPYQVTNLSAQYKYPPTLKKPAISVKKKTYKSGKKTKTKYIVSWKKQEAATGYTVYYKYPGSKWKRYKRYKNNYATKCIIKNASKSKRYRFRVFAQGDMFIKKTVATKSYK